MAERKPLVFLDNNLLGELPAGDTLPVSVTWANITGIPANITSWAAVSPSGFVNTSSNQTVGGNKTLTGNLRINNGAPQFYFEESDTGKVWVQVANNDNFSLHEDNTSGANAKLRIEPGAERLNLAPSGGLAYGSNVVWHAGNFNPTLKADVSALAGYLPLSGGTMAGHLIIGNAYDLRLDSPTPATRIIRWNTGGVNRWAAYTNSTSESGSNAGSNFVIRRYADDGTTLSPDPYSINRATGVVSFGVRPVFAGNTPWDSGNVDIDSTGINGAIPPTISDADTITGSNYRFIRGTSGSVNFPTPNVAALYLPWSGAAGAMIAFQPTAQSFYYRTMPTSGGWNPWQEVWSTNNLADSGWQSISYGSGWGAYTTGGRPTPGVRKFGNFVKLRGAIQQTGATGATIITLPAGYRPPNTVTFQLPAITSSGGTNVIVQSNGIVEAVGSTPAPPFSLDGISFYVN